jgi:hypothetical protein
VAFCDEALSYPTVSVTKVLRSVEELWEDDHCSGCLLMLQADEKFNAINAMLEKKASVFYLQ